MKAFISHKSEDMNTAATLIADRLEDINYEYYFDKNDPDISKSLDRAKHIESEIEECTDLIVIITKNVVSSWWVPFEIGLATANNCRIVSVVFDNAVMKLPSFLRKWPVIDTQDKLDYYLQELENNNSIILQKSMENCHYNFSHQILSSMRENSMYANDFHDKLKRKFSRITG